MEKMLAVTGLMDRVSSGKETVWINPSLEHAEEALGKISLSEKDIADASERLDRFAPLIMQLFPETVQSGGIIESELTQIPRMKERLREEHQADIGDDLLFLKRDSDLPIAGSVKARGGIYEVLKHTEELALSAGILQSTLDDYTKLALPASREHFHRYRMQVGSTGNLGMSIGIMSAALGYQAIVHMSRDAKQWKKDYLRAHGVKVIEYEGDYGKAVEQGRAESDADDMSHFVDDEKSVDLFLGYAVAAERLKKQLEEQGVQVDEKHPLFVYIPCGVGGAPGGIAFGLKMIYGDDVHVFFVEPTQACCMLLGLATGKGNEICVQDAGLSGKTHADGLAVGRASGLVCGAMEHLLGGEMTVDDAKLYAYLRDLDRSEGLFIEPSSCAAFEGAVQYALSEEMAAYRKNRLPEDAKVTHVVWATGGRLVPQAERERFLTTVL